MLPIIKIKNELCKLQFNQRAGGRMDAPATGSSSMCKRTAVKKTEVLQGRAKGTVMVIRGQVASKGVGKGG